MPDLSSLDRKAQKALAGALEASERVLVTQTGESAALVATNLRILICKWGMTSGAMFGRQVNSWDFAHVTGIEYRKGMTTKAIVVQTAGGQVVTKFGRMDDGPRSVWEAPNALFVSGNGGEATAALLREMVSHHHRRSAPATSVPPPPAPSTDDVVEQIRKFAGLRDDGLISEEEFQAKKRHLLGL